MDPIKIYCKLIFLQGSGIPSQSPIFSGMLTYDTLVFYGAVLRQATFKHFFKKDKKVPQSIDCGTFFWSVRPIKMFAKTLYLQGFAGQRRLFFLFFGWDLADFLPKGDFSVRPKKISAYSYFFSF